MKTEQAEAYSAFDRIAIMEKRLVLPVLIAAYLLFVAIGSGIWIFYAFGSIFIIHFGLQLSWSVFRGRCWMNPTLTKVDKPIPFWLINGLAFIFFLGSVAWTWFIATGGIWPKLGE